MNAVKKTSLVSGKFPGGHEWVVRRIRILFTTDQPTTTTRKKRQANKMADNKDKKFKDMEPKKDAKGGGKGGAKPGIPHNNPPFEQGKGGPSQDQGGGAPRGGGI
jgi:hypothetical protein